MVDRRAIAYADGGQPDLHVQLEVHREDFGPRFRNDSNFMRDNSKVDDMFLESLTKIVQLGVPLMLVGLFPINAPFVQLAAELSNRPAARTEVVRFDEHHRRVRIHGRARVPSEALLQCAAEDHYGRYGETEPGRHCVPRQQTQACRAEVGTASRIIGIRATDEF